MRLLAAFPLLPPLALQLPLLFFLRQGFNSVISVTTFAPDCPKLGYIELGSVKLHALYPNFFASNDFLQVVRRIGQGFEIYSSDIEECDMLNRAAVFTDAHGASLCVVAQAARVTDSPSRREKSHLAEFGGTGGRRLLEDVATQFPELDYGH